jgi:hypothetical protein
MMTQTGVTASSLELVGLQSSASWFYFGHGDGGSDGAYNTMAADTTTPRFWVYAWTPAGWELYRDGNLETSGSHQNVVGAGPQDSGLFFMAIDLIDGGPNTFGRIWARSGPMSTTAHLFNRAEADRGATGDLTLIGTRVGSFTLADRQNLEGWGAWRIGTQAVLPGGHPHHDAAPVVGGSAYTLTAAAGSYVLAGTAAALTTQKRIAASAGSYAVAGTAAAR